MRRLAQIVTLLAAVVIAWWACAPPGSLPAPVPMGEAETWELGVDGAGDLGLTSLGDRGGPTLGGAVGGHAHRQIGERFVLGTQLAAGSATASGEYSPDWWASTALYLRFFALQRPDLALGASATAGWLVARAGLFAAWRPMPGVWLYTHPQGGIAMDPLMLPVGMRFDVAGGWKVDVEAGLKAMGYLDELQGFAGVGVSRRF